MPLKTPILPSLEEESAIIGAPVPPRIENNYLLQYGALQIAADYCGLQMPMPKLRGEWQHGWHPPEHNIHPELVVGTTGKSREKRRRRRHLVAREDQRSYLKEQGYTDVRAVGMPILYVPHPRVERIPGSLLVMPAHSLATTEHAWNFAEYADQIASIKPRFSRVIACVHPNCFQKNYWVSEFLDRDIPVVSGASLFDVNALHRMALYFSRFEYVTSNQLGSQHLYAPIFNAKPSVYGNNQEITLNDFIGDPLFSRCPDLIDWYISEHSEASLRKKYPSLYCRPDQSMDFSEEAKFQLGFTHRLTPEALRKALGWSTGKVFWNKILFNLGLNNR